MKKIGLLVLIGFIFGSCTKVELNDGFKEPLIPVTLTSIDVVNIDNSGEFPILADANVKKEAFVLGVKWIVEDTPSDEDKFVTDPIRMYWDRSTYESISRKYTKAIKCNDTFNSKIEAGKYVSKYFKEIPANYLPSGIDEGFALLVAPDPGVHSFSIEYYNSYGELVFAQTTPDITFK